ncbi:uncharacterized protein K460DRAFT_201540 [Cucurbitaria berberidis CBS 394.84]|uniref:Uncharacterized protein n=1 Tax=Cucurbitaria berberidis CBS 394.84 TaxID=1168544 RepID=A0A9P4G9P6_9PLEO|nr:uncharacterized protein K460DRAFT_201540 [Cucurbitaria berberidis CBS 394.84]KAF1841270.1 hypothetical protein K460DRAFT_201540 [Cucurbitaria berberidis CBS 394.84]
MDTQKYNGSSANIFFIRKTTNCTSSLSFHSLYLARFQSVSPVIFAVSFIALQYFSHVHTFAKAAITVGLNPFTSFKKNIDNNEHCVVRTHVSRMPSASSLLQTEKVTLVTLGSRYSQAPHHSTFMCWARRSIVRVS